jgi:SagB-type dehydrogenase family enzyme
LQEIPPEEDDSVIALPPVIDPTRDSDHGKTTATYASSLLSLLKTRQSRRNFDDSSISLDVLSFLLWACEGVRENRGKFSFRTTPSGGARHPLDVYVFAKRIEGLRVGFYRYLPLEHSLVLEREGDDSEQLDKALLGQVWNSACIIMWAAVPYRSEWRYGKAADKLVALDAGHSCQNLYLACESLGLGTCAIGAYDQQKLDEYMGLDGEDMFAMYAAPIGKPVKKD